MYFTRAPREENVTRSVTSTEVVSCHPAPRLPSWASEPVFGHSTPRLHVSASRQVDKVTTLRQDDDGVQRGGHESVSLFPWQFVSWNLRWRSA
jgi:hypothetical protein